MPGHEGRRIYDKELQCWIEFENESDAAISELSLIHDIPLPTIDLMLQILRNPRFAASLLTLKKATDITEHVSLYRRKIASHRMCPYGRYVCVGVPFTVVSLLVEEILNSLAGLEKSEDEDISEDWRDMRLARSMRQDLQNISLVHRSWTPIAQDALRRSVIIRGQVRLKQLLCNHPRTELHSSRTTLEAQVPLTTTLRRRTLVIERRRHATSIVSRETTKLNHPLRLPQSGPESV